ncbi:hypothetical protein F895_02473 [Acinetobacter sp. CIP 64.2]|uniref:hypothetical protein n=1 Tax=unclassified Acinetobacter TaxID=196816 RepID=UPI000287F5A5|nr:MULTISPECIES: hypothetical protein [unclassified Acinetobacter]ENX13172.1 hypothetical protein F895_02473 [Acinetobacter sp. CIP 64.2]
MNHIFDLLINDRKFLFSVLSFFFLFLFFFFYIIQYFYVSYHLKGMCKVIFNEEKYFKVPLEPFNFFFVSVLPIVFWREVLNIKKEVKFKKLYGKDFYYPVDKYKLNKMLAKYKIFFYLQYLIYFFVMLWGVFMIVALILD